MREPSRESEWQPLQVELSVCGEGVTFTPDAVQALWRWSGGLPRLVNLLCDRALEAAYAQQHHRVDAGLVEADGTPRPAYDVFRSKLGSFIR